MNKNSFISVNKNKIAKKIYIQKRHKIKNEGRIFI